MKIVAFVPIKLNNQRLPGKNLLPLGGKPVCEYIFNTLLQVNHIDEVYAFCSDDQLEQYLPEGVILLKRDKHLDGNYVKGLEIYDEFCSIIEADIYILAHATSPFIQPSSIQTGLDAVMAGVNDSAMSVEKVQTFVWYDGRPLNYELSDIPRTQDIKPVWIETSAFFVFKREVLTHMRRRVGDSPKLVQVSGLETVDIDEEIDYLMARRMIGDQVE